MSRRLPSRRELREDLKAASIEVIGTVSGHSSNEFIYVLIACLDRLPPAGVRFRPICQSLRGRQSGSTNSRKWTAFTRTQYIYIYGGWGVFACERLDVLSNHGRTLQSCRQFGITTHWASNICSICSLCDCASTYPNELYQRAYLPVVLQLVGAIIASALLLGLTPGPLLIKTKLGDGTSLVQGVFIEMFCTAILLLAVLMLAAEKSALTPFAPIGISMSLFAVHMFAITFTGASLNPARSFGASCLVGFGHDHWIYWVGPLAGSCLSVGFYAWLKQYVFWVFSSWVC